MLTLAAALLLTGVQSARAVVYDYSNLPPNAQKEFTAVQKTFEAYLGWLRWVNSYPNSPPPPPGSSLNQSYFHGPVDGATYLNYIFSRIYEVTFDANYSICSQNDVACTIGGKTMWLTKNLVGKKNENERISVLETLIHEARHTDDDGHRHVACRDKSSAVHVDVLLRPVPIIDGKPAWHDVSVRMIPIDMMLHLRPGPACDQSSDGAYGYEVVFEFNIARFCYNCPPLLRIDAEIQGREMLQVINDPKARAAILNDVNRTHSNDVVPIQEDGTNRDAVFFKGLSDKDALALIPAYYAQ